MKLRRPALALIALFCLGAAADPADRLGNPAKEARARAIFRETRCLVCQGESIDDSDADLAADLRRIIRQRIALGASDAQVRAFLVARYGEFVLLRPSFSGDNALLWGTPFAVAAIGASILILRRRWAQSPAPLTAEEETQIRALRGEDGV
jgi:cytochrome c-type biogenesis protein CcmH